VDYVVFGIGFGATLVLVGWLLRSFGPNARYRARDGETVLSAAAMVEKLSWTRFVMALGAVVATGGALMLLATLFAILLTPTDRTGTLIVLSGFFLILIAACAWAWVYIGRYGTRGIVAPRTAKPAAFTRTAQVTGTGVVPDADSDVAEEALVDDTPVAPVAAHVAEQPPEPAPVESVEAFLAEAAGEDAVRAPEEARASEPAPQPETVAIPVDAEPDAVGDESSAGEDGGADEAADPPAADEPGEPDGAPEPEMPAADEVSDTRSERSDTEADGVADDAPREYVDILERNTPTSEASGRAEALRRLRQRRSSRVEPDER
jgi:hypothetical protein